MYKAEIHITLRPSILDPQGKATQHALHNLGYNAIESVRMGKYIEMMIDEGDVATATQIAHDACEKLLANEVMEDFTVTLKSVSMTSG